MYCILQIGSTGAFKIILIQCCVLSDLIRRILNYMCQILFICKGPSFRKSNQSRYACTIYTVKITQKEHLLIWNSETAQNLNIYLYNYLTETATFLATNYEKNNYGMQLFIFYKYFLHFELLVSNTIKNETRKKFKNLLGTNLVKYSSKFLAHIKNIQVIQAHQQMLKMIA